jgi:hypothetical protein
MPPKQPGRSLQPPPSLAGRFRQPAKSTPLETTAGSTPTDDQHAALSQIAKELREILDLLDEGDADIATNQSRRQ